MMHDYSQQDYEPRETYQDGYHAPNNVEDAPQSQGTSHDAPPPQYAQQPTYYVLLARPSDPTLAAALSYSLGWLTGLLFLLFGGDNRFLRFHATQSLLFFSGINVIDIALLFSIHAYEHTHFMLIMLFLLINFIGFVGWCVGIIQAARGFYHKLPFVGATAMNMVNP